MNRRELATKLGILTAIEKAVKTAKAQTRSEVAAMMEEAHEKDAVSSLDVLVGDKKVGRIGYGKPGVGICEGQEFGSWASRNGKAERFLVIPLDLLSESEANIIRTKLEEAFIPYVEDCKFSSEAKKELSVVGDRVVDGDGEIVPGTYVKRPGIIVTGCKPEDVARAMRTLDDEPTVLGLLGGDS